MTAPLGRPSGRSSGSGEPNSDLGWDDVPPGNERVRRDQPERDAGSRIQNRIRRSRQRVEPRRVIAAVCPFLAAADGTWRSAAPSREHRCFALQPPERLANDKQARLCLTTDHLGCPAYAAATMPTSALRRRPTHRPVPSTAPVILERPRQWLGTASLPGTIRPMQLGLAGLVVLALAVVILARGPGEQAGVGGASSSPTPSAAASVSSTVVPSVVPSLVPSAPAVVHPSASVAISVAPTSQSTPRPTAASSPPPAPTPTTRPKTYRVRAGDTLSAIAAQFGTTVAELEKLNGITDPRTLQIGQVLKLP